MSLQLVALGRSILAGAIMTWLNQDLNISHSPGLVWKHLHNLGHLPLGAKSSIILKQTDIINFEIPPTGVPFVTQQERREVELDPIFPELISDSLDQLESVPDMFGVIGEQLSRLKRSRGYSVRASPQVQTVWGQKLRMSVGVGLDSDWPLVDKVADLSHQGKHLVQAEHLLTHGLDECLLHTFHHLHHYLSSSILVLRVRHDE